MGHPFPPTLERDGCGSAPPPRSGGPEGGGDRAEEARGGGRLRRLLRLRQGRRAPRWQVGKCDSVARRVGRGGG